MSGSASNDHDRMYAEARQQPLFGLVDSIFGLSHAQFPDDLKYEQPGVKSGHPLGLWDGFDAVVRNVTRSYHATYGPEITLSGVGEGPDSQLDLTKAHLMGYDADEMESDGGHLRMPDYSYEWRDFALDQAAYAYKRECGWDYTPDESGYWLLCTLLFDGSPTGERGGRSKFCYRGNLIGFLILYDRDEDGEHESLAHLWTASAVRQKGVARMLVKEARRRFNIQAVERPVTDLGAALIGSVFPELFTHRDESGN